MFYAVYCDAFLPKFRKNVICVFVETEFGLPVLKYLGGGRVLIIWSHQESDGNWDALQQRKRFSLEDHGSLSPTPWTKGFKLSPKNAITPSSWGFPSTRIQPRITFITRHIRQGYHTSYFPRTCLRLKIYVRSGILYVKKYSCFLPALFNK
jgi:hypothetical protein